MTDVYNKLIRDNIPEIIRKQGDIPNTQILDDKAYYKALNEKLTEEVNEYLVDYNITELADIAEVIIALIKHNGVSMEEFEQIRRDKHNKNGGFDKKLFLVSVERKKDK